jgi:hypothetical protein
LWWVKSITRIGETSYFERSLTGYWKEIWVVQLFQCFLWALNHPLAYYLLTYCNDSQNCRQKHKQFKLQVCVNYYPSWTTEAIWRKEKLQGEYLWISLAKKKRPILGSFSWLCGGHKFWRGSSSSKILEGNFFAISSTFGEAEHDKCTCKPSRSSGDCPVLHSSKQPLVENK